MQARFRTALALAAVVWAAGCGHTPTAPKVAATPSPPATPPAVATFFQWCWQNRSVDQYRLMLAGDYQFEFAPGDSVQRWGVTTPWVRSDEESCATHMFRDGSSLEPPATSIFLDFLSAPTDSSDPRPGMNPKWHRLVTIHASLRVYVADGLYELSGRTFFYVVRGDSAQLPAELSAAGVKADSTRWWLERWVDGTSAAGPFYAGRTRVAAAPSGVQGGSRISWGLLKAFYH